MLLFLLFYLRFFLFWYDSGMRNTIKKHSDFAMGIDTPTVKTTFFIAKAAKTRFPGDARFGLIVTKKTFRFAVQRNRAKRLLRVWIRANDNLFKPEFDYIFIARRQILDASLSDGISVMTDSLKSLGEML